MKKNRLIILLVLIVGVLTGCGGMTEEDAAEYVKASLDAAYKGDFEAFVEITDSTPEGALAMYEENVEHTMEMAGFSDMNLSDELTDKYRQFFLNIMKMVDYEVGEATETGDGEFLVEVIVHPLTTFNNLDEKEIQDSVASRIDSMKKYPDEQEIIEISFEETYKRLEKSVQNPVYKDGEVIDSIIMRKNEEGMFYISEEEMLELDKTLFDLHN